MNWAVLYNLSSKTVFNPSTFLANENSTKVICFKLVREVREKARKHKTLKERVLGMARYKSRVQMTLDLRILCPRAMHKLYIYI